MFMNKLWKTAILNSLATYAYIIAVSFFIYFATGLKLGRGNSFLAPMALITLFVFSAALTGFLIFGKPAQMYVDGQKKDALSLLTYTLASFSVITLGAIISLLVFSR